MAALPKVTASMGMGDTASSASGGSEVDVAVVQVRSGAGHRFDPPSGTPTARCSLHGAPQRRCRSGAGWAIFSLTCLPSIGNLVLASTASRRGQDRDHRAALGSGVLSAPLEPATDRCSVVLDAGLAPKWVRQSPSHCAVRTRVGGRVRPQDLEITVCGVSKWGPVGIYSRGLKPRLLLAPSRRRTTANETPREVI